MTPEEWLDHVGLSGNDFKPQGDEWIGLCPFHDDNTPSMEINFVKDKYHCFGCEAGGSLILLATQLGMDFIQACFLYYDLKPKGPPPEPEKKVLHRLPEIAIQSYGTLYHPYLAHRGISVRTATAFEVRFNHETDQVVMPIRDHRNQLVGFVSRKLDASKPKYLYTHGFYKTLVLYNLHRLRLMKFPVALIVEGVFDVMKLYECHIPFGVATFGNSLADQQLELLTSYVDTVGLMYDNDDAGKLFYDLTVEQLAGTKIRILKEVRTPPHRKDIGDCTCADLMVLHRQMATLLTRRNLTWPKSL